MRIISTATGVVRHGLGAVVEAGLVVAIVAALVFGAALVTKSDPAGASDAFAAKGGKPGASTAGSSISLDQFGQALHLGSQVTFTTTAVGLSGGQYPMVYVECRDYGDGSVLYGQLDHPDVTFVLGGGSSRWWLVPNDAMCHAWLYAYGGKSKGYDTFETLAGPIDFYAGG